MGKPAKNVNHYIASAGGLSSCYFVCSFISLTCFKSQYFVTTEYIEPYIRKLEMVLVGLLKRLTDHASFKLQNLFTVSIFSKNTH